MSEVRLIDPPPLVCVPVREGGHFPVRRIYCVGRNYVEHIREMGGDEREPPFFFQKPADAIVLDGSAVPYPALTGDFQHEVELVLAIGLGGSNISKQRAHLHVTALGVGIDLTRRDLQVQARKAGRPWEIGKSFDHSAPCSDLVPTNGKALPTEGRIELRANGQLRQQAQLSQMIWGADEIVAELSKEYRLAPGDLIYTGTPAGVGPLVAGDVVVASVQDLAVLKVHVAVPEVAS